MTWCKSLSNAVTAPFYVCECMRRVRTEELNVQHAADSSLGSKQMMHYNPMVYKDIVSFGVFMYVMLSSSKLSLELCINEYDDTK